MESLQALSSVPPSLCIPSISRKSRQHARTRGPRAAAKPIEFGISPSSRFTSSSIGFTKSRVPEKSRGAFVFVRALDPNHHDSDTMRDDKKNKKEDVPKDGDEPKKDAVVNMQDLANKQGVIRMKDLNMEKDDATKKDGDVVSMQDLANKQGVIKMQDLVMKEDAAKMNRDLINVQGEVKKQQDMVKANVIPSVLEDIDKEGCVLGLNANPEAWDSGNIGAPVVRRYLSDEEERWIMWYSGKPNGCEEGTQKEEVMGIAVSSNGLHWKRGDGQVQTYGPSSDDVGKVLDCSTNWWSFDTRMVKPSDVIIMSSMKGTPTAGVYWCYYTGSGLESVEIPKLANLPLDQAEFEYHNDTVVVWKTRPGLAMSHDGRAWLKIEGEDHSGSLFDVDANDNKWDSLLIAAPHVVHYGNDDLRMYYHSFDQSSGCFCVGYARSRDGLKWKKFGKVLSGGLCGSFDELGVKCPQVVPHPNGNGFLMIYEGVSKEGSVGFGLARSADGLRKWERCGDGQPIFTIASKENAWDSREIHNPCLVHMGGTEWRLYYQGVDKDGRSSIGMAICTDNELRDFKRCRGLHVY